MPATKEFEAVKRTEVRFSPEVHRALVARARRNKRSLNKETMSIIEEALRRDGDATRTEQGPWQPALELK